MERELSPRQQFLRQMAAAQDEQLHNDFAAPRQKALLRERRRPERRRYVWLSLALALAGATAVVLLWPKTLTFAVGDAHARGELGAAVTAPATRPLDLKFSDGSILALTASGRARVMSIDDHGAAILVERGHADVSIVPRPNGRWRVDAGPFEIHVKGTRFSFDWDPSRERLDFRLHEGAVVITAACLPGGRSLSAGGSLQASCRQAAPLPAPVVSPAPPTALAAASSPPSAAPLAPSWRQLAGSHDYRAALNAAMRVGFEDECRRASAADALLLGDVARFAGDSARALQAYGAARGKNSGPNRSAFAMGLVEFDQRRRYARAAEWFSAYVKEQPSGPLVEEAQGRSMDAWQRAGNRGNARAAAESYLSRYPRGQYADLARSLTRP